MPSPQLGLLPSNIGSDVASGVAYGDEGCKRCALLVLVRLGFGLSGTDTPAIDVYM